MPNPQEVATIIVGGQQYSSWKTVSVQRSYEHGGAVGEFDIIEIGDPTQGVAQGITVASPCQIQLGGVQVLDGFVEMVQRAYTAGQHGVKIRVVSKTILTVKSSVRTSPGQFKNYTLTSLVNSIAGPLGVSFSYDAAGAPPNAEKPFERVSLNVGESMFNAIARLARMRNVFMTDDANGNLVGTRATGSGGSGVQLTEGVNIKSAIAVLSSRNVLEGYESQGQNFSTDQRNGRPASGIAATGGASGEPGTYKNTTMPMPGDSTDAAMHCQNVIAHDSATSEEITVVTQGWFADGGNLWIAMLGQPITINSPLLFPNDQSMSLYIRSVTHKQSDATGSETEIVCCNAFGLGGDAPVGAQEPGGSPAQPEAPDTPGPA